MKETDRLVCVREFWTEAEASIARAVQQENGIECATQGGQIRTTLNYYGSVIEGVKIFVAETDAVRAEQVLEEAREPSSDDEEASGTLSVPGDADFASDSSEDPARRVETEDDRARRLMRGGILGLLCVPVLLITIPLLLSIDKSRLTARGRRERGIGLGFLLLTTAMWGLALTALVGDSPVGW